MDDVALVIRSCVALLESSKTYISALPPRSVGPLHTPTGSARAWHATRQPPRAASFRAAPQHALLCQIPDQQLPVQSMKGGAYLSCARLHAKSGFAPYLLTGGSSKLRSDYEKCGLTLLVELSQIKFHLPAPRTNSGAAARRCTRLRFHARPVPTALLRHATLKAPHYDAFWCPAKC